MLTKIMKWVSSAILLLTGLRLGSNYQVLLELVVCVSSLLVVTQAVSAGRYLWAAGFVTIAVLFNPVVPVGLSGTALLWLNWICLATFLTSLAALKMQPALSIPSITNRTPGSQSL